MHDHDHSKCGHDHSKDETTHCPKEVNKQLKGVARMLRNVSFLEVLSGAGAMATTGGDADWTSWTSDSFIEFIENHIIGSDGFRKYIPEPILRFVTQISQPGMSHAGHNHGLDEPCDDPSGEHELKEKFVSFISRLE